MKDLPLWYIWKGYPDKSCLLCPKLSKGLAVRRLQPHSTGLSVTFELPSALFHIQ